MPVRPSKSGDFLRSFVGADAHIGPPRRETENAAIFRPTHDFPIPVVGADDPVRPSKSGVFPWSFVGADAHIGPLKCCEFASDFRKNGQFRRADRVVRPYNAKSKPSAITPIRPYTGRSHFLGRVDVGIDPYGVEYKFHEYARRLRKHEDNTNAPPRALCPAAAMKTKGRPHRTIRQADSARDFSSRQGLKGAGILYVFQAFQTAELAEKIRRSAKTQLCGAALDVEKGRADA